MNNEKNENMLHSNYEIFNIISDGVLVIDKDFRIVFANKAMLDLCGLKTEDVAGRKCHDLAHGCSSPCPAKCIHEIICPHAEAFQNNKATSVVHAHTMPDGAEKTFSITSSPVRDKKGEVVHLVQVLRDMTETQQAKKTMERSALELQKSADDIFDLYNNAPCGYHSLDKDGMFVNINDTELKWLGYSREEVLGKKKFSDIITLNSNSCVKTTLL